MIMIMIMIIIVLDGPPRLALAIHGPGQLLQYEYELASKLDFRAVLCILYMAMLFSQFNKWISFFHASVLLWIMNFVIKLSK